MNWYKIVLTKEQIANGINLTLTNQFGELLRSFRYPEGVALYQKKDDAYTYYLPPSAMPYFKDFILEYHGEACDPPDNSEIVLMVNG